jgi:beta-phosphoglucomutase
MSNCVAACISPLWRYLNKGGIAMAEPIKQTPCGLIFDLDGVLVTTDVFHFKAWKRLADELGLAFDEQVNHQLRGVSRVESLKRIYRHNNKELPSVEEFNARMARKNEWYKELIATMKPEDLLPNATELLDDLRKAGIKVAIASASKNMPKVVEVTGLSKYIDATADGSEITHSKPDPEVFLLAAKKLGCDPRDCIGVEDAESGVEAIQRGHMLAIGIGEQARKAELVVDSVAQLSVERIIDFFNQHCPAK